MTSVVFFAITLIVGLMVFGLFEDSASSSLASTSASTAAVANLTANTYSSYNILSVGPVILAGATILAVIGVLGRRS